MVILEAIGFLLLFYLTFSVSTYIYAVIKSYEFIGVWKFKMEDGYVGVIKFPKWLSFWMPFMKEARGK